jgi:ATP-dependent DNA ligase
MAVSKLPVRSCLIDGEACVCDENGLAVFDLIRRHGAFANAVICAFDLLELDGQDLPRHPIEKRKELLAELLCGSQLSLVSLGHLQTSRHVRHVRFTPNSRHPRPQKERTGTMAGPVSLLV